MVPAINSAKAAAVLILLSSATRTQCHYSRSADFEIGTNNPSMSWHFPNSTAAITNNQIITVPTQLLRGRDGGELGVIQRTCQSLAGQNLQDQFTGADVAYTAENVTGGAIGTPRSQYAGFSWVVPFTQADIEPLAAPNGRNPLADSGCEIGSWASLGINDMMVGLCDANAELIGTTGGASILGNQLLFGFHFKGTGMTSTDIFEIVTDGANSSLMVEQHVSAPNVPVYYQAFQQAFQRKESYQLRISLRNTVEFLWKGVLIYESNVTDAMLKPCAFFGDVGSRIENVSWVHRDNYESLREAAVDATFGQMATLIETTEAGLQANINTTYSTLVASMASNEATQTANLNSAVAVMDQNISDVHTELAAAASSNMVAILAETARATAVETLVNSQLRALVSTQVSTLTDADAAMIAASTSNATVARELVTSNLDAMASTTQYNLDAAHSDLTAATSTSAASLSRTIASEASTANANLVDATASLGVVMSTTASTLGASIVSTESTLTANLDDTESSLAASIESTESTLRSTMTVEITALNESAVEGRAQLADQTSNLLQLAAQTADENYVRLENHTDNTRDMLQAAIAEVVDNHEQYVNLTDTSIGAIHAAIADIVAVDESQSGRLDSLETQVAQNVADIIEERRLTTMALDLLTALHANETTELAAELAMLADLSNASDVSLSVLVRELNASLLASIGTIRDELDAGIDSLSVGLSSASEASDDDKKESSTNLIIAVAVGSLASATLAVVVAVLVLRSKNDPDRTSPEGLQRTTPDYLQGKVKGGTVGMVNNPVYADQAEQEAARGASGDGGYFEDPGYQAEDVDGDGSFRRKSILRNNPLAELESQTDGALDSGTPGI